VKFQSACFERYGWEGVRSLDRLIAEAADFGFVVILDAKRGDIGLTAEHYARATNRTGAQWVTINAYLGADGMAPFLEQGGAFALVRTSNPGGDALQSLVLKDGRTLADAVSDVVADVGRAHVGECGYSRLGAVVGATKREDAARLRERMPQQILLVPGYGAQGGAVDDVLPCFHPDGRGAIITASRSVIYAFERDDENWVAAVRSAAEAFAAEISGAVRLRERTNW
jgi:orotidine-5'-phosphate decarboxylase